MAKSSKSKQFYNMCLSLLGIRIQSLNFNGNSTNFNGIKLQDKSIAKILLTLISIVVFIIPFILFYPGCIHIIISQWPICPKNKSIDFIVLYTHYYVKYFTVIIIFICEFITEKQTAHHQHDIERLILQIKKIYLIRSTYSKKCHSKIINWNNLNVLSKIHFVRNFLVLSSCILLNSFRYCLARYIYQGDHSQSILWGSLPNLFTSLFILHSSGIITQYTNVFDLLNELMDVVASDICRLSPMTMHNMEYNVTMKKRDWYTAMCHIETLMECHSQLKSKVTKVWRIHSIEWYVVILKDFLSIIFEVRLLFFTCYLISNKQTNKKFNPSKVFHIYFD